MMKKIALIGYGELGKQFENLISELPYDISITYFDDLAKENNVKNSYPFNSYLHDEFRNFEFLIGLGYKHLKKKKKIIDNLVERKRKLFTFVHSTAIIDKTAKIEEGTVIYPNVTIDKNVKIGKGCLLNLSVTVSHDSVINDCCYLSPSVTISGFVMIGEMVFLGTGVNVANNIKIDSSAIVGIGSTITRNIESGQIVIGNPQRVIKSINLT
jgi:sugar O-acyltransferase (sialic acid O-acetyltransferase NeuD family)